MNTTASVELATLIGRFLRQYAQIQTLRSYASAGLLPESVLPDSITTDKAIRHYLVTADGLGTVQRWARSFRSTFEALDTAVREQDSGVQFDLKSWQLGIAAESRTIESLVTRLRARSQRSTGPLITR